jgi:DNA helicase II / ATP-dependent DNA helicase PcrA
MLRGMAESEHSERVEALLEGLNEPQREAVTHGEGPLLILAGAGSGKTRVLTHRIAFLIFTGQAHASEILAITFTNKAAQEMRGRVEQLLNDRLLPRSSAGPRMPGMWLMTFHAACARILRSAGDRLGYTRSFTIYDQLDARRLVKACIQDAGYDTKRFAPAAIHSQISRAKNELRSASEYEQGIGSRFEEVLAETYRLYERELLRMNAMDFDDLLFRTVNLFELHEDVRMRYAKAFKHVLVDEYQDTNHAQYRLLQLLVGGGREKPRRGERVNIPGHRNLAVVGDDSQSIYSFRGADVSNILDFSQDFPDARVVKLEQNYRSTQMILSAANAVIANNDGGLSKQLWSDLGEGSPIRVEGLADEHAEARFVVGEIERLFDGGASRSEIAIFYRTNAMSRVIEDRLTRAKIGYQVIGGPKFYERAEVKDAMAYLTWIANPFDVGSFQRIANSPRRGLGQTSLSRIVAHSATVGEPVWEVAGAAELIPGLGVAAVKSLGRFMTTMEELAQLAREGGPIGELLEAVLARTGYVDALDAEAQGRGERSFEAEGRLENLGELVAVAREFDQSASPGENTLDVFLQQRVLAADSDARRDDEGLVTLMTLHNAKGLEYPIVFVVGCEEGVFPHQRALDEGALEEERRLFYVGVTRAMRELYLTYARRRTVFGTPYESLPSGFLSELPPELTSREEESHLSPRRHAREVAGVGSFGSESAASNGFAQRSPRTRWRSSAHAAPPAPSFRLGEDVVHASFGEGIVTGLEPGGIIVVRFAGDGSERKLVDGAPVTRRA